MGPCLNRCARKLFRSQLSRQQMRSAARAPRPALTRRFGMSRSRFGSGGRRRAVAAGRPRQSIDSRSPDGAPRRYLIRASTLALVNNLARQPTARLSRVRLSTLTPARTTDAPFDDLIRQYSPSGPNALATATTYQRVEAMEPGRRNGPAVIIRGRGPAGVVSPRQA